MLIKEMTSTECRRLLASTNLGRLGCAQNGQPYVIPIYFAFDGEHLFGTSVFCFSKIGQKIEWMRANPLVCLEVDDVRSPNDWTSVVVLGHYEELPDTAEHQLTRRHVHQLLSKRAVWWEPASVAVADSDPHQSFSPIYYRIYIDHLTGRRCFPNAKDLSSEQVEG